MPLPRSFNYPTSFYNYTLLLFTNIKALSLLAMTDETNFKKYKRGEQDDDVISSEQVHDEVDEPFHDEVDEPLQEENTYKSRQKSYQTNRSAPISRKYYQTKQSGYTPKGREYVRTQVYRAASTNSRVPREYSTGEFMRDSNNSGDQEVLNNNTTLQSPAIYTRFPLNIIGKPTGHHFHFLERDGIVIEYELDTTPWSNVFIKYSHKVLRVLVPIAMNRDKLDKVKWTNVASRKWIISVSYEYDEDEIAGFLWETTRKLDH